MIHIRFLCLICILSAAAVMDMKTFRVKNGLIAAGFVCGLAINLLTPDFDGWADCMAGMTVYFIFLVLYKYSMLGAGDIKLLVLTGFYLGLKDSLCVTFLTFLFAALSALYKLISKHIFWKRLHCLTAYVKDFLEGRRRPYMDFDNKDKAACIHMAPAMLAAAVVLYLFRVLLL